MTERDPNLARKSPIKTKHPANQVLARCCDGKVRLERLASSGVISARAWIQGRDVRKSTGYKNLPQARIAATQWWQDLCVKARKGESIGSPTFAHCAEKFLQHTDRRAKGGLVTAAQARNYHEKWNLLFPMLAKVRVGDIDAEFLETLRETRGNALNKNGDPITPSTVKKDFIFVMATLKYAKTTLKTLEDVPQGPAFTGTWSIQPRGAIFFTEAQYQTLHQAAKAQCDVEGLNPKTKRQRQSLYWFILISVGGALRVDEARSVRWCDCELLELQMPNGTTQETVRMMVLGKTASRKGGAREEAYVLFGGVFAYKQMLAARSSDVKPEGKLFPEGNHEGMKRLLKDLDLYEYRDPSRDKTLTRNSKSLRPTAITLRLDKGDNVSYRDISNWARTDVTNVAHYYDQATPESSAVKVATFKVSEAKAPAKKRKHSAIIRA